LALPVAVKEIVTVLFMAAAGTPAAVAGVARNTRTREAVQQYFEIVMS